MAQDPNTSRMAHQRTMYITRPWDQEFEPPKQVGIEKNVIGPSQAQGVTTSYADVKVYPNHLLASSDSLTVEPRPNEATQHYKTSSLTLDTLEFMGYRLLLSLLLTIIRPIRVISCFIIFWHGCRLITSCVKQCFLHYVLYQRHKPLWIFTLYDAKSLFRFGLSLTWIVLLLSSVLSLRCFVALDQKTHHFLRALLSSKLPPNWPSSTRIISPFFHTLFVSNLNPFSKYSFRFYIPSHKIILFCLSFLTLLFIQRNISFMNFQHWEILTALCLGIATVTRPLFVPWTNRCPARQPRPLEAACVLVGAILIPFSFLVHFLLAHSHRYFFFNLFSPVYEAFESLLQVPSHHNQTFLMKQCISLILRILTLVFTCYTYFHGLDEQNREAFWIPQVTLLRSMDDMLNALSHKSYTCQFLCFLKLSYMSEGCPKEIPLRNQVCINADQQRSLDLKTFESSKNTSTFWDKMHFSSLKIFFADLSKTHQILCVPLGKPETVRQRPMLCRPFRLHQKTLATLGWNQTVKRPVPSGFNFMLRCLHHLRTICQRPFQRSIWSLGHDTTQFLSRSLFRFFHLLIPSKYLSIFLDTTLSRDSLFPSFLFHSSPVKSLRIDFTLFFPAQLLCTNPQCYCSKGLVLNYWAYAMLWANSSKIWETYVSSGFASMEPLYHSCCALRMCVKVDKNTRAAMKAGRTCSVFILPLELLVHFQCLYTLLENNYRDILMPTLFPHITQTAFLLERKTKQSPNQTNVTSGIRQQYTMECDYTVHCSCQEFEELVHECLTLQGLFLPLAISFSKGLSQWFHIMQCFKQSQHTGVISPKNESLTKKLLNELSHGFKENHAFFQRHGQQYAFLYSIMHQILYPDPIQPPC